MYIGSVIVSDNSGIIYYAYVSVQAVEERFSKMTPIIGIGDYLYGEMFPVRNYERFVLLWIEDCGGQIEKLEIALFGVSVFFGGVRR